jgi:hypothetical protein
MLAAPAGGATDPPTLRASAYSPRHSPAYPPSHLHFRPGARRSASPSCLSWRSSGRTATPESRRR